MDENCGYKIRSVETKTLECGRVLATRLNKQQTLEISFGTRGSIIFLFFFRRDALKEQFGKEPSTVRCLAVKSALLGTRHPRKEKEAALQTVTGKPACLDGKI